MNPSVKQKMLNALENDKRVHLRVQPGELNTYDGVVYDSISSFYNNTGRVTHLIYRNAIQMILSPDEFEIFLKEL